MISNAHFWNAGARSYNPICLNPLLVLDKISPLPGSSVKDMPFVSFVFIQKQSYLLQKQWNEFGYRHLKSKKSYLQLKLY